MSSMSSMSSMSNKPSRSMSRKPSKPSRDSDAKGKAKRHSKPAVASKSAKVEIGEE